MGLSLSIAVGVKNYSFLVLFIPPEDPPHNVMTMPSREFRDLLVTDRAESALFFPEIQELPFLFQVGCHFQVQSLLEIRFPLRVVRIGCTLDFDMSFNWCVHCS